MNAVVLKTPATIVDRGMRSSRRVYVRFDDNGPVLCLDGSMASWRLSSLADVGALSVDFGRGVYIENGAALVEEANRIAKDRVAS